MGTPAAVSSGAVGELASRRPPRGIGDAAGDRAAPASPPATLPSAPATLARYGRSFHLAGRLLPRATFAQAAELYAFCRAVDDLADEQPDLALAGRQLLALRRALVTGDTDHALVARFSALQACTGVRPELAVTLIDTVLGDLGPVRMPDETALLRYAYGVAGTVGRLMCPVLGAKDPAAAAYAVQLGVAMQLTNIARDVAADAAVDRIYLPASWLPRGLTPAGVGASPEVVFAAVRRLLALADRHYRGAELGYHHLPARVRPAIRTAARLYEEIGRLILARGPGYLLAGRCVVPNHRKVLLMAGCLVGATPSVQRGAPPRPVLAGLPGPGAS